MSGSRPVRRAGVAGMTAALLASSALAAGLSTQPAPALAEESPGITVTDPGEATPAPEAAAPAESAPVPEEAAPAEDSSTEVPSAEDQASQMPTDVVTPTIDVNAVPTYPAEAAAADGQVSVGIPGSYETSSAEALLARINEIRAEAGVAPLEWSTDLEYVAQIRAAESSLFSYTEGRPNGLGTTTGSGNTFGVEVLAENFGYLPDAATALESWTNETGIANGFYQSLTNPDYTHVGLSAFRVDGNDNIVLVAEFSSTPSQGVWQDVHADGQCVPAGQRACLELP